MKSFVFIVVFLVLVAGIRTVGVSERLSAIGSRMR